MDVSPITAAFGYGGYLIGAAAAAILAFKKGNAQSFVEVIKAKDELIKTKSDSLVEWKARFDMEKVECASFRNEASTKLLILTAENNLLHSKTDVSPILEHLKLQTSQLIEHAKTNASIAETLKLMHDSIDRLTRAKTP